MPGRNLSLSNYRFEFNGQEIVEEISSQGNHNTALFWEYDSRLGRRWNLDPKPSIGFSDYSTFRNNSILLSDVLGDKVGYKTDADKKFIEKFTSKTEMRRGAFGLGKIKERSNKNYNEEFAKAVTDLDKKDETYVFGENNNLTDKDGKHLEGKFSYDGSQFNIEYSTPPQSFGGGKDAVLLEETSHAKQFTEGRTTFIKGIDGQWNSPDVDLRDEVDAKLFACKAKSYSSSFNINGAIVETQLGYIKSHTVLQSMNFLKNGASMLRPGTVGNLSGSVDYKPIYPNLNSVDLNSDLTVRTFNNSVVGYPHK